MLLEGSWADKAKHILNTATCYLQLAYSYYQKRFFVTTLLYTWILRASLRIKQHN